MKRLISVSVLNLAITKPSIEYVASYPEFGITCKKLMEEQGLFKDKYILELEGERESIQKYLEYLEHNSFFIEKGRL